jgi:CheY-like chemotaxis protein
MKPAHAILLVEDNPADVKITQQALRESAVPVELIVVRDGQEAVDYLLRQPPHHSGDWRSCAERAAALPGLVHQGESRSHTCLGGVTDLHRIPGAPLGLV